MSMQNLVLSFFRPIAATAAALAKTTTVSGVSNSDQIFTPPLNSKHFNTHTNTHSDGGAVHRTLLKFIRWTKYARMVFRQTTWPGAIIAKIFKHKELEWIEFHITRHCNLNCVNCLHFSSLAQKEFMDITAFENDLKQLKHITGGRAFPYGIKLLGGEPLLNPQIIQFCEIARGIFPDISILILTNGVLLPKQTAEFWEKCAELNITISVTYYPVITDAGFAFMKKQAEQYGVQLQTWHLIQGSVSSFFWIKLPIDITGKQNAKKSYFYFRYSSCYQLWHGKLYPCAHIAYSGDFNRAFNQELEVTEPDYLDIYRAASIEEVQAFLKGPFPFCRYCKTTKAYAVPWRHNVEKQLEDWL